MQTTLIPMPDRIMPMLAKANPFGDAIWEQDLSGYAMERKFDGTRIIAIKNEHGVFLMSARSWKQDFAPHFPEIVNEIENLDCDSCILDGELAFFTPDGTNEFYPASITRETMRDNGLIAMYVVFDIIEYNGLDVRGNPYEDRHNLTENIAGNHGFVLCAPSWVCDCMDARGTYDGIVDHGGEGVVLKRFDSTYNDGTRTNDWIKVKREETDDYYLLGTTQGTGKRGGVFGALIIGQPDVNGKFTQVVKCGTGFTDAQLAEIDAMIQNEPTAEPYFPTDGLEIRHIIEPSKVVEVKFMQQSKNTIRHPVFVRLREDKE